MKRFFCLCMSLFIFSMMLTNGLAEDRKEIMFFGIPWGSSVTEISNVIHPEIRFNFHEANAPCESAMDTQLGSLFKWDCSEFKVGVRDVHYWFDKPQFKIAGYDLFGLSIECMYDIEDGKIIKDPDKTKFYAGQYYIRNTNSETIYDDLLRKLTIQYGEGTEVNRSTDNSYIKADGVSRELKKWNVCTEWMGTNNVKVLLVGTWIENSDDVYEKISYDDLLHENSIYISYYMMDCDERINELDQIERQAIIDSEQNSIDENNTEGL